MSYDYTPGKNWGPLRFGMKKNDIIKILGMPIGTGRTDSHPGFELVRDQWSKEERKYFSTKFWMDYCNPGEPDNLRPQLTLHDSKGLINIRLINKEQPFIYNGINLFAKKRVEVILALAALEDEVWLTGEDYYFTKSCMAVTRPIHWKDVGGVTLFEPEEPEDLEATLDFLDPDGFDAKEITGKEK